MRRKVLATSAAAALFALWLYGFDHFFDSHPGGLWLYTRAGLPAVIESACAALYTPAAVLAAIMDQSTGVFYTPSSTLMLIGCLIQIVPFLLMFSARLRRIARIRVICDRWTLVCAALWIVGSLYIHFPTRHAMTKGMAFLSSHEKSSSTNEAEQNGCRQRLVWHLSCHRRFPLAVA